MRRSVSILPIFAFLAGMAACEGPAGPMGPEGPAGPGTKLVLTASFDSEGIASATLPGEAGTMQNPPGLTCYLSDNAAGPFVVIGTDLNGPICALVQQGAVLAAIIEGGIPGWVAQFVIVF